MKLRFHTVFFFFAGLWLLPAPVQSQTAVADSLARLLTTAPPDTNRVLLLTELAWELAEIETDRSIRLWNEAIGLSQRLHFVRGEARAWNGLGVSEEARGNYPAARQHYQKALALRRRLGAPRDIGATLNNLGVLYETLGQFDSALLSHRENLAILQALGDTARMARTQFNIAGAYMEMGLYPEAQSNLNEARRILEARNDPGDLAKAYSMLGHVQFELDRYVEARPFYAQALELRQKIEDPGGLAGALTDYANVLDELDSSELAVSYYLRALDIWKQLESKAGQAQVFSNLGDAYKHLGRYDSTLLFLRRAEILYQELGDDPGLMEVYNVIGDTYSRQGRQEQSLAFVHKYLAIAQRIGDRKYVQGAYKDFAEVYAKMGNFEKAYEYRVKYDETRYHYLNEQISSSFARKEALFADEKKQQQIEQQKHALELRDALLAKSQFRQYALLGGLTALLLLVGLLYNRNRLRARSNRELAEKNAAIEHERRRADELLTNILPAAAALELKAHARVQPVQYESVTVLFTDFRSFTEIAGRVSPDTLIADLDDCFRLFDEIVVKHGLEKIKTIGDSYMCAGGLPAVNHTHPQDAVRAAIEMQRRLHTLMERKKAEGRPVFEMRIGIHTGPVVAGVVGSHKFAYDIWGDTVNTASRMEQGSESHKINISETTYQLVKDEFRCTYRGRLAAKNKGEVAMYFVEYD